MVVFVMLVIVTRPLVDRPLVTPMIAVSASVMTAVTRTAVMIIVVSRVKIMTVIFVQRLVPRITVGVRHVIVTLVLSRLVVVHWCRIINLWPVRLSVSGVEIVSKSVVVIVVVMIVVVVISSAVTFITS